jgi:hypothetical protein
MTPGDDFVRAVNKALADPNFRDSVRQMHSEGYPLVKMVDDLGLEDDMSARIRSVLEGLPPDVVEGIREATLAMLDSDEYVMPLDCALSQVEVKSGTPLDIEVSPQQGRLTIHVRSRASV